MATTSGMGELSFPDDRTIHLKPLLLSKREKLRSSRPLWSLLTPIPPILLWFVGLNLLLYPLGVVLLSKYREDFQADWRAGSSDALAKGAVALLDGLAVWILDLCPPVASAMLLFHCGLCLAYVSIAVFQESGTRAAINEHEKIE